MLKKIFIVIASFLAVNAYSAAPADAVVDAAYEWGYDASNSPSTGTAFDTLAANDSSEIIADLVPERGQEYILVHDAFTGTGSDSVALQVRVDCKDGSGNILYSTVIDSFDAAAGEAIALPFGGTLFGNKFDVNLVCYGTGDGTQVILNRFLLYTRKPITLKKDWR